MVQGIFWLIVILDYLMWFYIVLIKYISKLIYSEGIFLAFLGHYPHNYNKQYFIDTIFVHIKRITIDTKITA